MIVGVLVLASVVIVAIVMSRSADEVQSKLQTTTPSGELVVVSLPEFHAIENGMSLTRVEEITGGPGRVSSSTQIGPDQIVNYQWGGAELGSSALVGFRNGAVINKTQIGLTQTP